MLFSVQVICSTQKPGRSGNKATRDTDLTHFFKGNSYEEGSPVIIAHSFAQETLETLLRGTYML